MLTDKGNEEASENQSESQESIRGQDRTPVSARQLGAGSTQLNPLITTLDREQKQERNCTFRLHRSAARSNQILTLTPTVGHILTPG